MAPSKSALQQPCLTYDEYLREGEITYRYDIVDGVRIVPPAPVTLHQVIQESLSYLFGTYRREGGSARPLNAPVDVLIRKAPLRVRQPDVVVVSLATYKLHNLRTNKGPFKFAPELVVEIVSDSDRKRVLSGKMADYGAIGVQECWVVRPIGETLELHVLQDQRLVLAATYRQGEEVKSVVFPDLTVSVADVFAE
jgi:Uma2 family endonuclease